MYKLLEERGVRPTSIDVRQMNRFRQEKYTLQNGKKKKCKNRIEEYKRCKRDPELAKVNRRVQILLSIKMDS
jgi:hypothetical protein